MRVKAIFPALLFIWAFFLQEPGKAEQFMPGQYEKEMIHDGVRRTYLLHIPPQYSPQKSWPLVLLFHGGGGDARQALGDYGLAEKADKEGFILAAPNGTGRLKNKLLTWNVGFGFAYAMTHHMDDVGFVQKLVSELEGSLRIDPKRIYATGISNGGILCHFLAAELPQTFAAIAPVVGTIGGKKSIDAEYILPPQPGEAVSVIAFNGLLDQHIPYQGGLQGKSIGAPVWVKSGEETQAFWVKADQCAATPQVEENKRDQYRKIRYSRCSHDSEVLQYLIFDQGHAWPGGKKPRLLADAPSGKVNATDLMWEFFRNHPKK